MASTWLPGRSRATIVTPLGKTALVIGVAAPAVAWRGPCRDDGNQGTACKETHRTHRSIPEAGSGLLGV